MATTISTTKFLPGLGDTKEHVVGRAGVGINIICATLVCNTAQTVAQLLAAPPNTNTAAVACGPIVHSLGRQPAITLIEQKAVGAAVTGLSAQIGFQYVTANNSAAFFFAKSWTGDAPAGVGVRIFAIPE